jgi:2-polyprenyl-6-methoxyphenol hydroxylase-like FAD-dependent oxidoreductase
MWKNSLIPFFYQTLAFRTPESAIAKLCDGGDMDSSRFDLVTIGGGMAASALAISMARKGVRVLVLEKETQFKDRVRGEALAPWGLSEARELDIADLLLETCAKEIPWVEMGFGPRNLLETTSQKAGFLTFSHPEMQEALLGEAERAGAHVRRGVTAQAVELGSSNTVVTARNGKEERITARLVTAADGRGSACRKWTGFQIERSGHGFQFSGVLLEGVSCRDDFVTFLFNPDLGLVVGVAPQVKQKCRAYLGYPTSSGVNLQGSAKLETFFTESRKVHPIVAEFYTKARSIGPLASFDAGESWVNTPYKEGVALIGDAAATSDPSFGQGMGTALRDVRVLRDALLSHSDWHEAGQNYAQQHNAYFQNSHKVCDWLRTLFQDPSLQAQKLRQRAMPKIAEDLTRVPDHLFGGPDLPSDETVRARLFGEI